MEDSLQQNWAPGPIVLFGSGETSPSGRKIFETLMRHASKQPRVALLETPAGFELNSPMVIGKIADFLRERLQNYRPVTTIVPARKRNTPYSPDNPDLMPPIRQADMIFMGPGSPSYAVRQLRDSLAWYTIIARNRLGASLALASAATIAFSAYALPVYEIYKVGEEPHWIDGLDFFAPYGLHLVFVPHWNNNDGGSDVDTSRCFMGQERFEPLLEMLPEGYTVVGLDEKTALWINLAEKCCKVLGHSSVTVIRNGKETQFHREEVFDLDVLGPSGMPEPQAGLPDEVWQAALAAQRQPESEEQDRPSPKVMELLEARQQARLRKDWVEADRLRKQIVELGWQVKDTPEGQVVEQKA